MEKQRLGLLGSRTSRRGFLAWVALGGSAAALGACKPQIVEVEKEKIVKETVIVEGTPKVVEKVVTVAQTPKPADYTPNLDKVSLMGLSAFPAPTPRAQNSYLQELERRLGCQLDFIFVPSADWSTKLAATLASGDIPDAIALTGYDATTVKAIEAGAIMKVQDLGIPKETRNLAGLQVIPDMVWKNASLNGTIVGIPNLTAPYYQGAFLRRDWISHLGMALPDTVEDLKEILVAFAKKDPDGNGKNDTIGFAIGKGRSGWPLFLQPFGVPNGWRVESGGGLTHQDVTDEMKAALSYMREVYAAGALNPDFPTLTDADLIKAYASGIAGGRFGSLAALYSGPNDGGALRKLVPDADPYPITPPNARGFKAVTYYGTGFNRITVLNGKYAKDQEKAWDVVKVINFWLDPATEDFVNFGFEGEHHRVGADGTKTQTDKGRADIQWIRAWGPRHPRKYEDAPYVPPDMKKQIMRDTERLSAFAISNPVWGLWPDLGTDDPTAQLTDLATNTFERIIRGEQPLSAFDTFKEEWLQRGGRRLSEAWNAAYKKARG